MGRGALTAELRRLDPAAGRTHVRAEALAGLAAGLEALLGGGAVEPATDGDERVLLAVGARGAAVCVAPRRPAGEVAVVHSTAPEAVQGLAAHLGVILPPVGGPGDGLSAALVALLGALDAAVTAAREQAAHRLHDGPVQELTAVQLLIDDAAGTGGGPDAARVHRGVELLRNAILSCRQLMSELASGRPGSGP